VPVRHAAAYLMTSVAYYMNWLRVLQNGPNLL
jgi:hypothetical protein